MGRTLIIVIAGVVLVAGAAALRVGLKDYGEAEPTEAVSEPAPQPKEPVQVFSKMTYSDAMKAAGSRFLLVDATATWCGPCKMMERDAWVSPEVAAWVKEHGLAVQVDVDEQREVAGLLSIQAMPTVILFRDGTEVARNVGYISSGELVQWLNKHGV